MPTKVCNGCGETKPTTDFNMQNSSPDKLAPRCKPCRAIQRKKNRLANKEKYDASKKKYRQANPELYARWRYKSRHGIYKEDMEKLFEAQGNVCKLCNSSEHNGRFWVIDHDHSCCGDIKTCEKCRRGILCENCNKLLGFAKDNVEVLAKAIEYLEEYERSK